MSGLVVWDFDYTLFDAASFKDDMKAAVVRLGVSEDRFDETYREVVSREGKVYDYDPAEHLDLLAADLESDEAVREAAEGIHQVLANAEDYLYEGALELMERLRATGVEQVMVTLGNADWQRAKVENSGLAKYLDRIVTIDGSKAEAVRELAADHDAVYVVNDNGQEVAALRESQPELNYILVDGPKGKPAELELEAIAGLAEVERELGLTAADQEISREAGLDFRKRL
jgi:FMN phosphatase YigB (HAD superfamily)